jgi:hypothetical protein
MSEPVNEPISLQVGGPDDNGVHRWGTARFTGEQLAYYEGRQSMVTLYRWLDRGYLVYVEGDEREEKSLYPHSASGGRLTAEEVSKRRPRFANAVGITPDTDLDFS